MIWETSSNRNLKDQVAIVTGGANGIGAATAYTLAREGAHIVIIDLANAETIVSKINSDFPDRKVEMYDIDIQNERDVHKTVEEIANTFGRIDILVNNAGICGRKGMDETTAADWDIELSVNLKGTFLLSKAVIFTCMKEQQYGKIINISSIAGVNGGVVLSEDVGAKRSGPAYAASKGGIIALTKWVAKEVGKYGIYCNAIAPGPIATEKIEGVNVDLSSQPIGRLGRPEDISEVVTHLASPASNYLTGQIISVCGGVAIG